MALIRLSLIQFRTVARREKYQTAIREKFVYFSLSFSFIGQFLNNGTKLLFIHNHSIFLPIDKQQQLVHW